MSFVPGQITTGPGGIQLRQVFCPACGFLPSQWWAPYRVRRHECSSCGHVDEEQEFYRGGATDMPTAAPDRVSVDESGYSPELGIQGVPCQEW